MTDLNIVHSLEAVDHVNKAQLRLGKNLTKKRSDQLLKLVQVQDNGTIDYHLHYLAIICPKGDCVHFVVAFPGKWCFALKKSQLRRIRVCKPSDQTEILTTRSPSLPSQQLDHG